MPNLPKIESGQTAARKEAADRARGKTAARGYDGAHRKLRAAKLAADPICQIQTHCQGAVATEIDHIIEIEQRPDLRLDWSNIQSSCKACNVAKRNRKASKTGDAVAKTDASGA